MLLVVGSRGDAGAAALVSRWGPEQAALVSADDLSSPGWAYDPRRPGLGTAIASDCAVPVRAITGVVTRRPCVLPDELTRVAPEDRTFAAAEMTAFLLAWLSGLGSLRCPVLNPPTASCLNGPGWRPEHWASVAAGVGVPVRPVVRAVPYFVDGALPKSGESPPPTGPGAIEAIVVGDRVLGCAHPRLRQAALRLARAARTPLLDVWFDDDRPDAAFAGASAWPDLGREDVLEALQEVVGAASGRGAPTRIGAGGR